MYALQRIRSKLRSVTGHDVLSQIDAVIYINLDSRPDRRVQVESELRKVFPESKLHRFAAIHDTPGAFGCSRSHIEVLRWAETEGWDTVMVVEDDLMWTDSFHNGRQKLNTFTDADVILLCGSLPVYNRITSRVRSATTTTGYIVRRSYIPILRANFEEGLSRFRDEPDKPNTYSVDQYWKRLMQRDKWYIVVPGMATQRPGKSDTTGLYADYRSLIP